MRDNFIGRKKELQMLTDLLKKRSSSLIVVKGRRRIGKSRLLKEFANNASHYIFSGLPPTNETTAEDQREEFARQLQRELKIPLPRADDWGDLFWFLSQHTQKGQAIIVLDEISWMGSKDHNFLGKLKNSWDLYFKNNHQLLLILCGSISSWIEENILSSTGFLGRISLDITLDELSLPECSQFCSSNKMKVSYFDKLKILSVTGGVPRYLEEIITNQSAESNIARICFNKEGFLFNEFERIFSDLFSSKSNTYKLIVKRLADGPCELKDIYEALKVEKSGVISKYMQDLVLSGFVSHDFTWNLKNGQDSKLSHYRLKDNYLRFYLKYIEPNRNKIEKRGLKLIPNWQSIIGLQFENLVLSNRKLIQNFLGINQLEIINDNPFFQKKTLTQKGCQIDYMIQTKFGTCYLIEIKFSNYEIKKNIIDEVSEKIKRIALPRNLSIRPVLIHVNGVEDAVKESDFFSAIINFGQFLETTLDSDIA